MATSSGSTSSALMRSTTVGMAKNDLGLRDGHRGHGARARDRPAARLSGRGDDRSTTSPCYATSRRPTSHAPTSSTTRPSRLAERFRRRRPASASSAGTVIWIDFMLGRWDDALDGGGCVHRRVRGRLAAHAWRPFVRESPGRGSSRREETSNGASRPDARARARAREARRSAFSWLRAWCALRARACCAERGTSLDEARKPSRAGEIRPLVRDRAARRPRHGSRRSPSARDPRRAPRRLAAGAGPISAGWRSRCSTQHLGGRSATLLRTSMGSAGNPTHRGAPVAARWHADAGRRVGRRGAARARAGARVLPLGRRGASTSSESRARSPRAQSDSA